MEDLCCQVCGEKTLTRKTKITKTFFFILFIDINSKNRFITVTRFSKVYQV